MRRREEYDGVENDWTRAYREEEVAEVYGTSCDAMKKQLEDMELFIADSAVKATQLPDQLRALTRHTDVLETYADFRIRDFPKHAPIVAAPQLEQRKHPPITFFQTCYTCHMTKFMTMDELMEATGEAPRTPGYTQQEAFAKFGFATWNADQQIESGQSQKSQNRTRKREQKAHDKVKRQGQKEKSQETKSSEGSLP